MKAYFDRTAPLFIVKEPSFDAIAVEVPESVIAFVEKVAGVIKDVDAAIDVASAPEESAQDLADLLTDLISGPNGS